MQIKEALIKATELLSEKGIPSPRLDAEVLLMNIIKKDRSYLYTHDDYELENWEWLCFREQINERLSFKPIAYITGNKEFMSLNFFVNENVLIPRADTEILVEKVLQLVKKYKDQKLDVLDLATGSGAVGLSLKYYNPDLKIVLSDVSQKALEIAKHNGKQLDLDVEYVESDLFENIRKKFDIIVSNPPYIASEEIQELAEDIKNWEPYLALNGGRDGYQFYKLIISRARAHLKDNGLLILEVGDTQSRKVRELLQDFGYHDTLIFEDYSGIERVVLGYFSHVH